MAVALLILSFRGPKCLRAALPIYLAADFDIFIHLDAKASLTEYQAELGELAYQCTFVEPRQNIFWAGFNMVIAEMTLLQRAMTEPKTYAKFVLVSDDSFPTRSSAVLARFFDDDLDRLMIRRLGKDENLSKRYESFFYLDHAATSLLGRPIESSAFDVVLFDAFSEMDRLRRVGKKKLDIYYGSQWWALTPTTASEVLRRFREDYHLVVSFKFSAVPDEMFVQMVVANYVGLDRVRSGCMLVDWSREVRPFVFFDLNDVMDRATEDHAFVRKISTEDPSFLTKLIDAVG